jgi:hypothetical protein
MAVQVRKVVEFEEGEKEFEVQLVCPFCRATYDVVIDPANEQLGFDLGLDETFCEHFEPSDCEWAENVVVFYFKQ